MNKVLITILIFMIISCGKLNNEKDNHNTKNVKTEKSKTQKNNNLISFDGSGPKNHEQHKEYKSKFSNPINIETDYIEDYIVATTYVIGNECLSIKGDFIIRNDSIILITKEKGSEPCDGISIKKLVFKIKNPEKKKYKLGYEGVFYDYNFN